MKIGITTSVMQGGRSGVGQYVLALVRALIAAPARHELTLFVLEDDLPLFAFASQAARMVAIPERYRPAVKNIAWHQLELPRLVRRLRLDVLHVPSYRRLLWPQPCAMVATVHDLAPFRLPKKYDWKRMLYGRVVVRRLARRQDEIIAVSQATANDLGTFFGLPSSQITVIHNGLDHARFKPGNVAEARESLARRHGLRYPFFLYVARLEHPAKNHVRLIEAFNWFKLATRSPWQLVLAGADWHGADEIHRAIRRSPYAKDIVTPGFVPDTDLPLWYRAAGVFVYPSLFEGFGLPPLEAMACGCPVLAATEGALAEVAGNAVEPVNPRSIPDIERQLERLAADEALRDRLRTVGIAHAKRFDWRHTAAATLEVYSRVAAKADALDPLCIATEHQWG
ncbi:MAG: glycosyltransferase family 1 protein [Rariglobus sp.]|jgi:glycosyltransferase involved in cell wall biosynthesis|nr:glycosyltransferase family 1 protein [Rariglobus sp.]